MNSELAFIEECKHKLKQIKQSKASKIVRIAESQALKAVILLRLEQKVARGLSKILFQPKNTYISKDSVGQKGQDRYRNMKRCDRKQFGLSMEDSKPNSTVVNSLQQKGQECKVYLPSNSSLQDDEAVQVDQINSKIYALALINQQISSRIESGNGQRHRLLKELHKVNEHMERCCKAIGKMREHMKGLYCRLQIQWRVLQVVAWQVSRHLAEQRKAQEAECVRYPKDAQEILIDENANHLYLNF